MHPNDTLSELLGLEEASKWVGSQSTRSCIPERIPKRAYSIIGKVMTDVTNMVESIEEIEVPRARLDEKVHKLATCAYPNRDDPASQVLWEEYIQIAAQMTDSLFERFKKVIVEGTRPEKATMDPDDPYDDLFPLDPQFIFQNLMLMY